MIARDLLTEDVLITAPLVEPLDLVEVKKQRRYTGTDLDTRFDAWISAARQQFEEATRVQLITATWVSLLPCFPVQARIYVRRAPVREILSVAYRDADGAQVTLDPAGYAVFPAEVPVGGFPNPGGVELLRAGDAWPTVGGGPRDRPGTVRIEYVAGYGDAPEDVPALIREALMQSLGDYHRFAENLLDQEPYLSPVGTAFVRDRALWAMLRTERMTRW